MGTDIHAVFQKRVGHDWIDIPCDEWDQNRHYYLFAWLADVRNGFGFAGVPTHEPIKPISQQRGLPEDFVVVDEYHPTKVNPTSNKSYHLLDDESGYWLGDHSHSWLLGSEILAAKPPVGETHYGVMELANYKKWNKQTRPDSYSGDVFGNDVVVSEPNEITQATTHVRIQFTDYSELDYFINAIRNLVKEHGTIRMVFGFDS